MYKAGLPGFHRCRSLLSGTKVTIIQMLGALHLKDPKQTQGEKVFSSVVQEKTCHTEEESPKDQRKSWRRASHREL